MIVAQVPWLCGGVRRPAGKRAFSMNSFGERKKTWRGLPPTPEMKPSARSISASSSRRLSSTLRTAFIGSAASLAAATRDTSSCTFIGYHSFLCVGDLQHQLAEVLAAEELVQRAGEI